MAKAQVAARFVTEVAPPQFVSIVRRRGKVPRGLDTIAEDDREAAAAETAAGASAFASVLKKPLPAAPGARTAGFMRELSKCFSDGGHGPAGRWDGVHKAHGRVVYYGQHLQHKNSVHGHPSKDY